MKYFVATLYLAAGIILPLFYVNIVEVDKILSREWILILVLFIFCGITGIHWLFSNKSHEEEEEPAPKTKTSPFKTKTQRKIPQPAPAQGKVVTAPRYVEPSVQKSRPTGTTTYPPPMEKPDITTLMEDIKNFIKLESWLMALQKANEMIHYYPDSPETEKIRGNINFLIQKVKGHD